MNKSRPKQCVICNEPIEGGQIVPFKGRTAHQRCFDTVIKTLQKDKAEKLSNTKTKKKGKTPRPQIELKDAISEEEYKQKQDYYNYIRKITGEQELNSKVYALSEKYIKQYGFTFLSMHQTLLYLNEIINKELSGDIIGIIPYYHSEAEKYSKKLTNIETINKDIEVFDMYKEKTIRIRPQERVVKQLDVESISESR